jgi:fermentation-respiration switch protein FrsA (DUF1100 family)
MKAPIQRVSSILLLLILIFSEGCTHVFFSQRQKEHAQNFLVKFYLPEDVFFKTPDGLILHGWFLKAHGGAEGTILALHGNAENLSTHVNMTLWLVDEGFNVFIFDYRGYGKSQGSPNIEGVHVDAEAALETLLTLPGVDKDRIIVLGQSIGGAIAVYTVANSPFKKQVKALVLDSAFSSYRLIAREKLSDFFLTWPFQYPLSLMFNDDYSPIKWIKQVAPVPVLIIHGEQDPVVPQHHGRLLYDAATEPKEFWQTAPRGHIRSFADAKIREKLVRYLLTKMETQEVRPDASPQRVKK